MPVANPLIIHVVARLKPAQCGVSDFALAISGALESQFAVDSAFVVVNSDLPCEVPYPRVYCPQSELLEACNSLSQGRAATLLVHLSGYGYSRNGDPAQLALALSKVRASGRFRIAVYFHELYATSMPWRSAFWHTARQKKTVRKIAADCDLLVTNTEFHAGWLQRETERRSTLPIQILPVLSNVGESSVLVPFEQRRASLVVFGLPANRRVAYDRLNALRDQLDALAIEELIDIGSPLDAPAALHTRPIRRMGILPGPEVANVLSHARFGFVKHPAFTFAKSGIFAAYCAHGAIPIVPDSFAGRPDGLEDGLQVLSPRTAVNAASAGLQNISAAAWEWYSRHRLRVHAETYARLPVSASAQLAANPADSIVRV